MVLPTLEDVVQVKPSGLYGKEAHDNAKKGFGGVPRGDGLLADVVRVPIGYLLEHWSAKSELQTAMVLPNKPAVVNVKRPSATSVEYTANSVHREHTHHRKLALEFSGRTGVKWRAGYNREGEIVFQAPLVLLREFDAFLDKYQAEAARHGEAESPDGSKKHEPPYLVLRCFDEKIHVRTEVVTWDYERNAASSRHSAEWRLSLHAYAAAEPEEPDNILGPVADAALYVAAAIDAMNALLAAGDLLINNVRNDLEVLKAPFQALQRTGERVGAIGDSLSDLADFPGELMAEMVAAGEALQNGFDNLGSGGTDLNITLSGVLTGTIARTSDRVVDLLLDDSGLYDFALDTGMFVIDAVTALGSLVVSNRAIEEARTRRDEGPLPPAQITPSFTSPDRAREVRGVVYTWRPGDTPWSVSERFYGDQDRWSEVVKANGWLGPTNKADNSPLVVGDRFVLPNTAGGRLPFGGDPAESFGVDIYVSEDGKWELTADKTDIRTVRGPELLEQSLRKRVQTRQGTALAFPGYGIPFAPGDKASPATLGYAAAHVREQLLQDPRVRDVTLIAALVEGDTLGLQVRVTPVVGQDEDVIIPVAFEGAPG